MRRVGVRRVRTKEGRGEKGEQAAASGRRFLWRLGGATERKGGRSGPRVDAAWREGNGEERGGPRRSGG
jgi:hypothetical protein